MWIFDEKEIGLNAKKNLEQDSQTDTFDVKVAGKVVVEIQAKDHQGRFEIKSIFQ